jgi:hypothetical protein
LRQKAVSTKLWQAKSPILNKNSLGAEGKHVQDLELWAEVAPKKIVNLSFKIYSFLLLNYTLLTR